MNAIRAADSDAVLATLESLFFAPFGQPERGCLLTHIAHYISKMEYDEFEGTGGSTEDDINNISEANLIGAREYEEMANNDGDGEMETREKREEATDYTILEDDHRSIFYDMSKSSLESIQLLKAKNPVVNSLSNKPQHAPITPSTGRFVYLVEASSAKDVLDIKRDASGEWSCRGDKQKGVSACPDRTESFKYREEEGRLIRDDNEGDIKIRFIRNTKPSLRRLKRRIIYLADESNSPISFVLVEYVYSEEGDLLRLSDVQSVTTKEKEEIKVRLLRETAKSISADYEDVSTQQINNIAKRVEGRIPLNLGPRKKTDFDELQMKLERGGFLRKWINTGDRQVFICWDENQLRSFAQSLPTSNQLKRHEAETNRILTMNSERRSEEIRSTMDTRGALTGMCQIDVTFDKGNHYLGKLSYFNRHFATKRNGMLPLLPAAYFFAKSHTKKDIADFSRAVSEGVASLGQSFSDKRVRSIVRDGESGLDALLEGTLFQEASVARCDTHLRKNMTDRFGDSGHSLATFVLGNVKGDGVRMTGLMDCASLGAARRAFERNEEELGEEKSEWVNQRLDEIYRANGLPSRIRGGFGFLTISNNVLECTNSWDMSRISANINLNDCIDRLFQTVTVGIRHMLQAPYGGGDLTLRGKQSIRKIEWNGWSTSVKDSYLRPLGLSSSNKQQNSSLPPLLQKGRTQPEMSRVVSDASDYLVTPAPGLAGGYSVLHKETDRCTIVRESAEDGLVCREPKCHRMGNHPICVHLIAVFTRAERGEVESLRFAADLAKKDASSLAKSYEYKRGGQKIAYKRWGDTRSAANYARIVAVNSESDFQTDASPIQTMIAKPKSRDKGTKSNVLVLDDDEEIDVEELAEEWQFSERREEDEGGEDEMEMNGNSFSLDEVLHYPSEDILTSDDVHTYHEPQGDTSALEESTDSMLVYSPKEVDMLTEMKKKGAEYRKVREDEFQKDKRRYERLAMGLDKDDEMMMDEPIVKKPRKSLEKRTVSAIRIDEKLLDMDDFLNPVSMRPSTMPYHNGSPFVLGHINEKLPSNVSVISRRICAHCMGPLPLDSRSPYSVVIYHREKIFTKNAEGTPCGRNAIALLHLSRKCLRMRYPYSSMSMLAVSQSYVQKYGTGDYSIREEFGCNLSDLPVCDNYGF